MTCMRTILIVMVAALALAAGCSKKKQEPAAGGAPATAAAPAQKSGAPDVTPQVKQGVRTAAMQTIAKLQEGDFVTLYRGASAGFKKIGSEAAFVTRFQQARMKTGLLSNPQELSFEARPNGNFVVVYRVSNDRYTTDWRLTYSPTPTGGLELAGLNQHDELKK